MGKHTDRGAVRFLKALRPKVLVPMHLQGDAALASALPRSTRRSAP